MAAVAAAAAPDFSTSFRTSQSQPTHAQSTPSFSYTDTHITQLPTIDFKFDDLRRRMSEFTTKFDAYIERGRKQVLEERNEFRARLSELNEDQTTTTTQINTLTTTLNAHTTHLTHESTELTTLTTQIASLTTHATTQRDQRSNLQSAITTITKQIAAKRAAQVEYAAKYDEQARQNGPELQFWETYLGCRIEGAGEEGVIRVVYCFAGTATAREKGDREATFELEVPESGMGGYRVSYCKPKLEASKVERVVDRLNETRDIACLLKGMRGLFREEMGERMVVR